MMGLVRQGRGKIAGPGFLVSWDIDSRDRSAVNRTQYFLFGRKDRALGDEPERSGFVWKEGVRYLAQSAVAVRPGRLAEVRGFLSRNRIDHEIVSVSFER